MKKRTKSILALLLAIVMVLSCAATSYAAPDETPQVSSEEVQPEEASADGSEETASDSEELETEELDPSTLGIKKLGEEEEDVEGEISPVPDTSLNETVRVSIFLKTPATLDAGYSPDGVGTNAGAISYRNALKANQSQMTAVIESAIGYSLNVKWNLTLLVNAISGYVKVKDIPTIERLDGVLSVQRETRYEVPREGSGAQPNTKNTSSLMVGASDAWSAGYTGAGTRIAIIDTGIDTTHQSFSEAAYNYAIGTLDDEPNIMTAADVSAVASQLNSKSSNYVSAKIPYGYNYVDGNTTITHVGDTQGEHGSHVAGIAAANRYIPSGSGYVDAATSVFAVGMAPDAQLLVMKVFGANGGAYDSDYMSAIEDAVVLGCDACNLSLGSSAQGFTYSNGYQDVLNNLASPDANYGMVCSISAGNSYALTQNLQTDLFIDDVFMHTGGSPGTYVNSLCTASAENVAMTGTPLIYNGQTMYYTETVSTGEAMVRIAGTHEFVYIDSVGDTAGYTAVDEAVGLSGKIVIVNRGELNFTDKGNNAIPFSPKAVIVANNQPGTISMSLEKGYTGTFPMVAITLDDANTIKAGATKGTAGDYTYYTGSITVSALASSDIYSTRENAVMSSYSSWGVPGSLLMKPEITTPGGNIYSVFGTSKTTSGLDAGGPDRYELMSGTSMAAPHTAGLSAVTAQYLNDTGITVPGYSRRALIQSLMMSTATPMKNGGSYVSVLQQGAGLADVSKVIGARTAIFMTNAGLTSTTGAAADGKVKVELGDDPAKTGGYSYSFRIYNLTNDTVTFEAPRTDIFTQGYYDYDGYRYMDQGTVAAGSQTGYTWVPSAAASNPHDVNQDGSTNDLDAQAILDYLTGEVSGDALNLSVANMDTNAAVNSYDAYLLLQYVDQGDNVGCFVPANGYADVTISFGFGVDSSIYTSGAYIEGFTYVTEKDTKDGAKGVQHSIPILGYYGSWTDPSMFDNTSYTDVLYGTDKVPYTGNADTNYLTVYYNGIKTRFTGNPYIVEEEFPTERLALNSESAIGNLYYSLYRAAGTMGLAVSKLNAMNGNITEVIAAQRIATLVEGIWYYERDAAWQNTGVKTLALNMTPADFNLAEDDIFRIGVYAIPEYNAMKLSSDLTKADSAVLNSDEAFETVITSGALGDGAYVGFDFTIDDTLPEIGSATLNGTELTVSATDNQNLAYLAVLSLDGETVYAEEAPGTDEFTISFDAAEAIENAKGYVAVFAADYAGNETALAVKVNDNVVEEETVYVLTDTITAGENYLVANVNAAGDGVVLGHNDTAVAADAVTVNAGTNDTDNAAYIKGADVDETSVWTVADGLTLQNGEVYLGYTRSGNNYTLSVSDSAVNWTAGTNTLSAAAGNRSLYVTYSNSAWALSTRSSSVYFYEERTISHTIDPYKASSIELKPASLDIYKGNVVSLMAEVLPLTVEDRSISWSTSDPSVATVDALGNVTAVAPGNAIITATSNSDESVTAECPVKVTSVDKALNGIIWDEEGEVFFSNFNTNSLPAWNTNHNDDKGLQLASAFMQDAGTLYTGTFDTSGSGETVLYTVDRSTYDLTEYGTNFVWATDIAIGATTLADYVGMVYTYAYSIVAGPIAPEDDGEGGIYSGVPWGSINCSALTDGAYFAGIACKSRSADGGTYYVLDENGDIWETTLGLNSAGNGFEFSTPIKVLETGIATSFLYQNLYYDGTYLYWSHYADNVATLYIIDVKNEVIYNAGNFGEGVWPATGMYVNGSVAPASADETMGTAVPANLSGLRPVVTRSQLMTPDIQARLANEAARFAVKQVKPAAEPAEEPTEPVEEPTEPAVDPTEPAEEPTEPAVEPTEPEAPTEPAEPGAESGETEPTEPAPAEEGGNDAGTPEESAPAEDNGSAETEEPGTDEVPDPEYSGAANAVSHVSETKRPVRNDASLKGAEGAAVDGTAEVSIEEANATHNGLYTVAYDPAALAYIGTASDAAHTSVHVDEANGTVTFAYATLTSIEANEEIALVTFDITTDETTTVTVTAKERNDNTELDDETEVVIDPDAHVHSLVKVEAKAPTGTEDGNTEYYACDCGKYFADAEGTTEIEEGSWIIESLHKQFVRRMYETVLERPLDFDDPETGEADKEGFDSYTAALDAGMTGGEVAAKFIFSNEIKAKNLCNNCYITLLYNTLLGRDPEPAVGSYEGALAYWNNVLTLTDTSRYEAFLMFIYPDSDVKEFKDICEAYEVAVATSEADIHPENLETTDLRPVDACEKCGASNRQAIEAFVKRLYTTCLGREADEEGLKSWTDGLMAGVTGYYTAYRFVFGDQGKEGQNAELISQNLCDEHFVKRMYKALLDRELTNSAADQEALESYVHALEVGMTREEIFDKFVASEDFSILCRRAGIIPGNSDAERYPIPADPADGTHFDPTKPCTECGE